MSDDSVNLDRAVLVVLEAMRAEHRFIVAGSMVAGKTTRRAAHRGRIDERDRVVAVEDVGTGRSGS